MRTVIIIGNGIAGITTARHLRKKSDCRIVVISDEAPHFFSRTALMYVYMGHMTKSHLKPYPDDFWKKNRIELIHNRVAAIHPERKQVELQSGDVLDYSDLVIATGSKPVRPQLPGIDLEGIHSLYFMSDLGRLEADTPAASSVHPQKRKKAIITGGGLIGIELAEMLMYRNYEVTLLVRDRHYWASVFPKEEARLVADHLADHGLKIVYGVTVSAFEGTDGRVSAAITSDGKAYPCELAGVTIGVTPNIDWLNGVVEKNRGVLTDEFLATSVPNIYAAGDCVELRNPLPGRRAIEPVWYVGRMMGECLGETLSGQPSAYRPGNWFNSAKFFDLEYQTYGQVAANSDEHTSFFFRHPRKQACIRIAFDDQRNLVGLHAIGIRLRHAVIDAWLNNRMDVDAAVQSIHKADFEPEFAHGFERELIAAWNSRFGTQLTPQKPSWLQRIIRL